MPFSTGWPAKLLCKSTTRIIELTGCQTTSRASCAKNLSGAARRCHFLCLSFDKLTTLSNVEGWFVIVLALIPACRFTHTIAMAARVELVALSTELGGLRGFNEIGDGRHDERADKANDEIE